jgi:prolyl oligopeptidase
MTPKSAPPLRALVRAPRPAVVTALFLAACSAGPEPAPGLRAVPTESNSVSTATSRWQYPRTRKDDVVDDYHGTRIADPYRWLEDQDGNEVVQWVAAQNKVTRAFLDAVPERAAIRARLQELWNYPRWGAPRKAGPRWIYGKNDGLQNQSVLWITGDLAQPGEVLLDPNRLSADGTVALSATALDEAGRHLAYATSARGSDWMEWRVLDLESRQTLPDTLQWSKFSGAAWTHDGRGFFYQRYPAPKAGEVYQAENRNPQLCYHRLGTAQDQDIVVYERPDQPEWGFAGEVTEDGRYLVIAIWTGTDRRNRIARVDLQEDGWPVQPLLMEFDASYDFLANDGATFYVRTDKDAPRGRIVAVDLADPAPGTWRDVVPEGAHALQGAVAVADRLVLLYLEDASHRVLVKRFDGSDDGEIALPALGSAGGFTGRRKDTETFFTFTSYLHPSTIYRYDFATKELGVFRAPGLAFDATPYVTKRAFLQSKDGTRLCLFLTHRKGLRLDGGNPTYLYGYGGFNVPITPSFSVSNLVWIERGGVLAVAVLRGGSEYGEEWHQAGMLANKQNVFDDFIACAEYLVRNGYTRTGRLAIGGGSNGGLLVGAVLTQRPDLIGAAVPEVGVFDMLRYHKFTIGWAWAPEYGTSDDPEHLKWLLAYSPLHNVRDGTAYPAVMMMTGDHDDRVLPGHSYKFAARLQEAQAGPGPVLIRIETDAGHGAGKPTSKLIDEAADRWAFLVGALR